MMGWRRLWKHGAWRQLPIKLPQNQQQRFAPQGLFSRCFSTLQRQVCDNLGRRSEHDSLECDSSDSPDPPIFCETFRRAMGALTALLLPFRSLFATAAFSATSLTQSCLRVSESWNLFCLDPTKWHASLLMVGHEVLLPHPLYTGLQNKHFRGTLVRHGVGMYMTSSSTPEPSHGTDAASVPDFLTGTQYRTRKLISKAFVRTT